MTGPRACAGRLLLIGRILSPRRRGPQLRGVGRGSSERMARGSVSGNRLSIRSQTTGLTLSPRKWTAGRVCWRPRSPPSVADACLCVSVPLSQRRVPATVNGVPPGGSEKGKRRCRAPGLSQSAPLAPAGLCPGPGAGEESAPWAGLLGRLRGVSSGRAMGLSPQRTPQCPEGHLGSAWWPWSLLGPS